MMWFEPTPFVLGGSKCAHLKVNGLSAGYGPFLVLRDLTLEIKPGLTVILGPNGAGKTTLLKALSGLIPRQGEVLLGDEKLPTKTNEIVKCGMALVAEGRQLFPQMTVTENLELGGWLASKAERVHRLEQAFNDFPKLRERAHQLAGTMSGGEQQMVAVARALSGNVKLLLLDEPFEGLAPTVVQELFTVFDQLRQHVSIVIVEHNLDLVLALADRVYALERGAVFHDGPAEPLLTDLDYRKQILWL